ncbi:MAG: hypothetical protein OXR62_10820 [Ahrensia sp.]|nr:hypothetical protein [Ahrensia sp.]
MEIWLHFWPIYVVAALIGAMAMPPSTSMAMRIFLFFWGVFTGPSALAGVAMIFSIFV